MADSEMARTKDFFAAPALSLSLAGVFRNGVLEAPTEDSVEENSGGLGGDEAEMSSENAGADRSNDEEDAEGEGGTKKKRKKYHRHTAEQIREMEALFKESPHPDEKQRQQLSKQLGLSARQVKFWFQNRRTQIKAIQERHENSVLKTEMEKLREENQSMREAMKKAACPNCGYAAGLRDAPVNTEEQQLRIENARLKAEIEKLRAASGNLSGRAASPTSSCSGGADQDSRGVIDYCTGFFGLEKSKVVELVNAAMEELVKMATAGEPLWVRSVETGRDILNYDEYVRRFSPETAGEGPRRSVEASRESCVVFMDAPKLVQAFMDANQWKELFPCMVAKAATVEVIADGDHGGTKNGAVQLMFAELQMLTPVVPTREVYFVRCCKQQAADSWAIVDVSIDRANDNADVKCRKRPSGCLIQDKANGHSKITWVEHLEVKKMAVHSMYRTIINSGLAFGAKHWMATLQLQCERLVFFMATNVPTKDSNGVATLAGRKSTLRLAQRMTSSFCKAVGASTYHTWTKVTTKTGEDVRLSSRKNIADPAEPVGVIVCAISSVWLPVSPIALLEFLRDDTRRNEWDIISNGGSVQTIANIAKGQDRGNSVTLHAAKSNDTAMWILQDTCTNAYESMLVYAPVDITGMQSVMNGCDSSSLAILPSGFSILPDGLENRPLVITSKPNEKASEGGSLLTMAFQILANTSPTAKLTMESMETVNTLISCTLQNIRTSLDCEDA
ncbi:unnamed protein product [Victoria cruziana]